MSRKSIKGLRFNLASSQPVAIATLPEAKPVAVALYIVPPGAGDDFDAALIEFINARPDIHAWIWRISDGDIPTLPQG